MAENKNIYRFIAGKYACKTPFKIFTPSQNKAKIDLKVRKVDCFYRGVVPSVVCLMVVMNPR
jgi:hypothetical protein